MVNDKVFSNAVKPHVKRRLTPVGLNSSIRLEPNILGQVFGDFGFCGASEDIGIQTVVVFFDQGAKGIDVTLRKRQNAN